MATISNTSFFSPTQISGCSLWLDAADANSLVLSGGNVSVWRDKSGNTGRDAVPSTGSGGTYPSNRINGLATVGMTISGNMYAPVPAQTFSTELSAFVVFMKTGTTTRDTVIYRSSNVSSDTHCSPFLAYSPNVRVIGNGTTYAFTNGATNPFSNVVPTLYNFNISSNADRTWNEWLNGTGTTFNLSGGTAGYGDTSTRVWLGTGTNPSMAGVIAEVIMYNRNPSTAQRQQIEGYLAWKWGLQSNLPSSHPFYNYNPNVPNINLFTPTTVFTSPLQVSGCSLWLDAADPFNNGTQPTSGTTISTWNDKSGNVNNATQATLASMPTYLNIPAISNNGIYFASNSMNLTTINNNTTSGNSSRTIFVITYLPNSSSIAKIATGTNTSNTPPSAFGIDQNPTVAQFYAPYVYTAADNLFSPVTVIGLQCIYAYYDSSVSQIGGGYGFTGFTTKNTTLNTTAGPWQFGRRTQDNAGSSTSYICEFIHYNRILTTAQRQQVEGYLAWKWGLQSSLPTTHPFYNFNPSAPLLIQQATLPIVQSNTTLITMSPTQISGCALWLDAADLSRMTIVGSNITQYIDKSSNGIILSNTTVSQQPTLVYDSNNMPNILLTSNASQRLVRTSIAASNLSINGEVTILFVHSPTNTQNSLISWTNSVGMPRIQFHTPEATTGFKFDYSQPLGGGRVETTIANYLTSGRRLEGGYKRGTSHVLRTFGSTVASATNTIAQVDSTLADLTFGAFSSITPYFYSGRVCEIVWFNRGLTDNEINQLEGYLAWKWGVQANLPTSHPYYYNPLIPNLVLQSQLLRMTPSFSPLRFSGTSLWLDAADPASVITSGSVVTRWNDKSGNLNHATPSNNPIYSGSNIDIVNSGFFNGSINIPSGALQTTAFTVAVTPNIFSVEVNRIVSMSDGIGFDYNSPNGFQISAIGSGVGTAYRAVGAFTTGTITTNRRFMCTTLAFSSGGFVFSYNGHFPNGATSNFASNTNTSNTNTLSKYYIGVPNTGGNNYYTVQSWKGLMNEIIIFNRTLIQSEYQQVEGYLAWKWGLQSSLPANHPYVLFPPN